MCRSSGSSRRRAAGRSGTPRPRRRRGVLRGRPPNRPRWIRARALAAYERCGSRSRRDSRRERCRRCCRTLRAAFSRFVSPADQLTVARALSVPIVIVLFAWDFTGPAYWAPGVFCVAMATDVFDGKLARRHGRSSALGSLLDPIADKVLVLGTLVMLVGLRVVPAWMVATIVVREVLITGLRQAAIERGVVLAARDLGKLKTWAQAIAAALGGFAAAGAWGNGVAWWSMLVALALTWASGLDYARNDPRP